MQIYYDRRAGAGVSSVSHTGGGDLNQFEQSRRRFWD